jgi:uncharacterized protein affecting Mg2+/Co2+ transport
MKDIMFGPYRITIVNLGEETVQLLARHWKITDALGRLQEVKGDGCCRRTANTSPGRRIIPIHLVHPSQLPAVLCVVII